MGNQNTHLAADIDDDILARAGELLQEAHARKRGRDEELAAPAPMFSLPKPKLPDVGAAVGDEYTSAVLAAATAYINSGGKACKPIETASAGSIGRKSLAAYEPSDSSAATQSTPSTPLPPLPPPSTTDGRGATAISAEDAAQYRHPSAARAVVYKCRRCGCNKRSHVCVDTAVHSEPPAAAPAVASATAADHRLRPWTVAEDEVICAGVKEHGYKWSLISTQLDGRTDNAVRNRWHRLEAARKWRLEMHARQQSTSELPGYKCGRCGQPKRGHTCPYQTDSEAAAARAQARALARGQADDISDIVSDAELAELFASLEASPAAEEADGEEVGSEEADMSGLVESFVNARELEQILSSGEHTSLAANDSASAATPELEKSTVDESAAWFASAGLTSAEEDELLGSADGAVCF